MRVKFSFEINFDIEKIVKTTGKTKEEFIKYVNNDLLEDVTSMLNYEITEGDIITVTNVKTSDIVKVN